MHALMPQLAWPSLRGGAALEAALVFASLALNVHATKAEERDAKQLASQVRYGRRGRYGIYPSEILYPMGVSPCMPSCLLAPHARTRTSMLAASQPARVFSVQCDMI